ncbi:MAG: CRISPR-associated ring nuclease Crn3/Csx3 [Bacteroidota bacterium]|nr:CRISPR-associated ring nuclease Crn3/Csx3 [Bacteroidota bacterium]
MKNLKITFVGEGTTESGKAFQFVDLFIGGDGNIAPEDLKSVRLPKKIDWSKGVVLSGKGPIWLYGTLIHLCHPATWVAVDDPRIGAVVVESHAPEPPFVGDIIGNDIINALRPRHRHTKRKGGESPPEGKGRVIAIVGPPHRGKSVLMRALRDAIKKRARPEIFQREIFLYRSAPDGEGDWFGDMPPNEAKLIRVKKVFDDEHAENAARDIRGLAKAKSLVFVDCGGKIDRRNQRILNECTHAVIVGSDERELSEWRGAAAASGLTVVAEIRSVRHKARRVARKSPPLFEIGPLERGNPVMVPTMLVDLCAGFLL